MINFFFLIDASVIFSLVTLLHHFTNFIDLFFFFFFFHNLPLIGPPRCYLCNPCVIIITGEVHFSW